jgi:uncharacterized protein YjbI with pentapeptide repeats
VRAAAGVVGTCHQRRDMSDFIGADLSGSRFERVDLRCAEFRTVDLTNARFRGVALTGVVMDLDVLAARGSR